MSQEKRDLTMGYHYRDDLTWADTAFDAEGASIEELFRSSADAVLGIMIDHPESIEPRIARTVDLEVDPERSEDWAAELLHDFLQRLIFFKDADELFLRVHSLSIMPLPISSSRGPIRFHAELRGEPIDPARHSLGTDPKAITHHQFRVSNEQGQWKATVVVDT